MPADSQPDAGRRQWERRWRTTRDEDFEWSLAGAVAPQLRELLERTEIPEGRALDLGCGAGVSTRLLADRFSAGVGVDIAESALHQATLGADGSGAGFAAADALRLPFPSHSFSFLFDRGCLQNLPQPAWQAYFQEVDRVLVPGAVMQLLVSKMTADFPSLLSTRGLRLRWSWYVRRRRGGAQFLTHEFLTQVRPASFAVEQLEDFAFVTSKGKARRFTHAVFRKQ